MPELPIACTTTNTPETEEIYELEVLPTPPDSGGPPQLWICICEWSKGPGASELGPLIDVRRAVIEFAARLDDAKRAEMHALVGRFNDATITLDLAQARQYARDVAAAVDALENALHAYEKHH